LFDDSTAASRSIAQFTPQSPPTATASGTSSPARPSMTKARERRPQKLAMRISGSMTSKT
jgi:hypothetical protein